MRRLAPFLLAGAALAQGGPAPVVVAPVVEREVVARRSFVGTVEAERVSTVGGEVEGLVLEFLAKEGARVAEGDVLARLRTTTLELQIAAARAELALRNEELKELRNGSRPEEIEQERAKVGQARAEHEIRAWKLKNAEQPFQAATISEDEVRDARLAAQVAAEKLREAEATLRLAEEGPRSERIDQAVARVKVQEAEIARWEDRLERHVIRALFAGRVVAEHTEAGAWLKAGDPVAEIAALDRVDVVAPVLEDYVHGLATGVEVPVTIDAIAGRQWTGKIHAVVPRADPRARTFPVKIRLDNPAEGEGVLLKAGMFARIHIAVGESRRAVLVPKDALVLGGPKPVVFVLSDDGKTVRPVPVETGLAVDGEIEVRGPVAAGAKVVVRGNERLRPPFEVQVLPE